MGFLGPFGRQRIFPEYTSLFPFYAALFCSIWLFWPPPTPTASPPFWWGLFKYPRSVIVSGGANVRHCGGGYVPYLFQLVPPRPISKTSKRPIKNINKWIQMTKYHDLRLNLLLINLIIFYKEPSYRDWLKWRVWVYFRQSSLRWFLVKNNCVLFRGYLWWRWKPYPCPIERLFF